jgi:acetylornithine/N-succinyldiaminopimelate aminotransferase
MNQRQLFLQHLAQTSPAPLALEITRAEGCYLYDAQGRAYLDIIGGISVCNMGHRHPAVVQAIKQQADAYLHVMVYGETVQAPQVRYAHWLVRHLPATLNSVYFTGSGTEATEGAMKLAKRVTGRTQMVACHNSYHGSTQGALSLMGSEYWRNAFRPLLPGIRHVEYNNEEMLDAITTQTACVFTEVVQAESGVTKASKDWLQAIRKRCDETGCLLVLDEIQSAFGRTGSLFGFEQYGVVPDILLLGKALGGGMPLGAFIADKKLMDTFTENPVLGHITTFGGHPVSCAAGLAAAEALMQSGLMNEVKEKEQLFLSLLKHPRIQYINSAGLWLAVGFDSFETNMKIIERCLQKGLFTDWFLFASSCLRIGPPLTITEEEIRRACTIILEVCSEQEK